MLNFPLVENYLKLQYIFIVFAGTLMIRTVLKCGYYENRNKNKENFYLQTVKWLPERLYRHLKRTLNDKQDFKLERMYMLNRFVAQCSQCVLCIFPPLIKASMRPKFLIYHVQSFLNIDYIERKVPKCGYIFINISMVFPEISSPF